MTDVLFFSKAYFHFFFSKENPGPGEYIPLESHQPVKKIDPSFKSVTIRKLWNTDGTYFYLTPNFLSHIHLFSNIYLERAPPMNTYDIANFNIANSSLKNVELDKELASKKPHFGSTEMRFVELRKLGLKTMFNIIFINFNLVKKKKKKKTKKKLKIIRTGFIATIHLKN